MKSRPLINDRVARDGTIIDEVKLVADNVSVAESCTKNYARGFHDEFIDVAYLGLCKAATKWEPSCSQFQTYATYWIRQYFARARLEDRMVRIPAWVGDSRARKTAATDVLKQAERAKRMKWKRPRRNVVRFWEVSMYRHEEPRIAVEPDEHDFLERNLLLLTENERGAIKAVFLDGMTLSQHAARAGRPRQTVRFWLGRAVTKLRRLAPKGMFASESYRKALEEDANLEVYHSNQR